MATDTRLSCPHCHVKTWMKDYAKFMADHDRPDGRVCRKAQREAPGAVFKKGDQLVPKKSFYARDIYKEWKGKELRVLGLNAAGQYRVSLKGHESKVHVQSPSGTTYWNDVAYARGFIEANFERKEAQ